MPNFVNLYAYLLMNLYSYQYALAGVRITNVKASARTCAIYKTIFPISQSTIPKVTRTGHMHHNTLGCFNIMVPINIFILYKHEINSAQGQVRQFDVLVSVK